jgi:hypothetical protein
MSIYGKRVAVSPKENMAKEGSGQNSFETDVETLVKIEFETINGKPFFGQVSDDELLYLWVTVLNRQKDELFGVTSTKSLTRNVRATFKLKVPVKLTEIFESGTFSYEKYPDEGQCEIITGKILGYDAKKPAELGELTTVTVKTNFGIEANGILNWLKLYGSVTSKHDFITNPRTGLKTDVFEAEILLRKHIEEYLPIYGQKAQVYYPGIQRMCNRCYKTGHLRRECNNLKRDWVAYIVELVEVGGIKRELIGSWRNAVVKYLNAGNDGKNTESRSPAE